MFSICNVYCSINLFSRLDKHLAGLKECSISYREKTESAKKTNATRKQQQRLVSSIPTDPSPIHGPSNRACHFKTIYDHSSIYRNDTVTKSSHGK